MMAMATAAFRSSDRNDEYGKKKYPPAYPGTGIC